VAKTRQKVKGRRESGRFIIIPHAVMESENWRRCSGTGIKLLLAIAKQFKGNNNGDLCASLSVLRREGWTSSSVLADALRELLHFGLIEKTRQGGLHQPCLYAFTWKCIDACGGKLDVPASTAPSGLYRISKPKFRRGKNRSPSPDPEANRSGIRIDSSAQSANTGSESEPKAHAI